LTYAADGHLVRRQCSGLVGADDGRAAESFNRWQTTNDSVLLGHTTGSESKTGRDDGRQTFGDSSDGKSDSDLEVVDGALEITRTSETSNHAKCQSLAV